MIPDSAADAPQSIPTLQARVQYLEGEVRCLLLRVQDLQQQLGARKGGAAPEASAAAVALSLFQELELPGTPPSPAPAVEPRARRRHAQPTEPRSPGRKPLDPALPREVIRLDDPPASKRVSASGTPLKPGFTEVLEVLARKPAVYFVKRFERTVWVSSEKTTPVFTPWPDDVLPRSGVHASVVAHIAAAHFCEHVPYYRLEEQLARTGVTLARSTQVSLMAQLDTLVAPLGEYIKKRVLSSGYVHLDATPIDVCDPARPGAARSATLWAYRARSPDPALEGLVWFDYQPTKSPARPSAVLRDGEFRGVVQTDGASGLDALGPPERITHLGCFAHSIRYFKEAVQIGDRRATPYLNMIDRLFRIEERTRGAMAKHAKDAPKLARIATWRERFSVPVVRALFARAIIEGLTLPPKTAFGTAVGYLLNQRASLERCVTTPGAYLDNNAVENAIRPLKLGARYPECRIMRSIQRSP